MPWGLAGLSLFRPTATLRTGGTQLFQPPRYPGDRRHSVLLGLQVPWGLTGLSSFSPPRTRGTGGTQSFQAHGYPADWRNPVLSAPQVPWGLALRLDRPKRTGTNESLTESPGIGTGTLTTFATL